MGELSAELNFFISHSLASVSGGSSLSVDDSVCRRGASGLVVPELIAGFCMLPEGIDL